MAQKDKTAALYANYIKDVVDRNRKALAYQKSREKYWQNRPQEEVKAAIKAIYAENNDYSKPKEKNSGNDFFCLQEEAAANILYRYFRNNEEVSAAGRSYQNSCHAKSGDEEVKKKLNAIFQQKMKTIFDKLVPSAEQEKYKEKLFKEIIVQKESERFVRDSIAGEFRGITFDGGRDRGNCTKGITASLFKLQKKYGVPLFPKALDKEGIVHPKDISEYLKPYVSRAESGLVKDIKNIKEGDVILLTRPNGTPGHAMMCHGFNDLGEPLLLGFSENICNVNAFISCDGSLRQGIRIDVRSFIQDKAREQERETAAKRARKIQGGR